MKRTFFAGLAILLPLAITLLIINFFFDLLTEPFMGFAKEVIDGASKHRTLYLFFSRVAILILLVIATFLLGALGRIYLFRALMGWMEKLFVRLPIVKSIYSALRDLSRYLFKEKRIAFKRRVLVPFPQKETAALALDSGPALEVVEKNLKEKGYRSIFVPTAPHPVSGFLLMMHERDLSEIPLTTEELFKILISAGLYDPKEKK